MRVLKYVERCTGGGNHDGSAWIAWVNLSRSGRTLYFNGRALQAGDRGDLGGNHYDRETREGYWVSGVKKSGTNRHWAGSGVILVERSAVPELLALTGAAELDGTRYRVTADLPFTDPKEFVGRFNEEA